MGSSSKKTEEIAVTKLKDMINTIKCLDNQILEANTGISWDGYIDLYNSDNIDNKNDFLSRLPVQIKGRTYNGKKFEKKIKFDIEMSDLNNYKKVDGTLFFLVRIKDNNTYKIYYRAFLPNNISNILSANKDNLKSAKVQLYEVKNSSHLESICKEFYYDREIQKKLSDNVFSNNNLTIDGNNVVEFVHYSTNSILSDTILGEEKNIYLRMNDEIVGVGSIEIDKISRVINNTISFDQKNIYFDKYIFENDIYGNKIISFGKSFHLELTKQKLNIELKGTLKERIKDVQFICILGDKNKFFLKDTALTFNLTPSQIEKYKKISEMLNRIQEFCNYLNIKKDINLDKWNNDDYKNIFIWINAILDKTTIIAPNWQENSIGSVLIGDLRFSVMTTRKEKDEFIINSIWDGSLIGKQSYQYKNGDEDIYTNNLFSVLNSEIYYADDIDITQMKNFFDNYKLEEKEEIMINLQALEVIKAYDINKNEELLEYAKYLLNKIKNLESIKDIAFINLMQINKRLNEKLTEEDIQELILIREKNNRNNMFLISIAIVMENLQEAKYILSKMSDIEKEVYKSFPICTLMELMLKKRYLICRFFNFFLM